MVLKQRRKIIGLVIKRNNLFIFNIQIPGKTILVKRRGRSTYLFSKNPQISLKHRRLGYVSNTRVVGASKLTDEIDILGEVHIEEQLSSDFEKDEEGENSKLPTMIIIIATSISGDDLNNFKETCVEQLCNSSIENKYTKIVRNRKMTPITHKEQEIYANLWRSYDLSSLSEKT